MNVLCELVCIRLLTMSVMGELTCISVIDDISRYSKFIANYFSKIGYLCKKIEVSNHGIESKNFVLLRLNI